MKLITPLIIIGICVAAYFTYISKTVDDISILSSTKSSYEAVLKKADEVAVKRVELFKDYEGISKANIEMLNKVIPEMFNSVLFANDINAMASRNNLVVKDFKIDPKRTEERDVMLTQKKEAPYKTAIVTFRLIGQYDKFIKFLTDVESSLRLIDVTKLSIKTVGGQRATDDSLEYSLEMNTYSLK